MAGRLRRDGEHAGTVNPADITESVGEVFNDEGAISNYLYESF